jgi:cellulose biosynthesis protein BcsQ
MTAIYLAALAAKGDATVTLVDADSQASAADWLDSAEDARLRNVVLVEAPTERLLAKALDKSDDDDVVIVDTPPGTDRLLARALTVADVAVVLGVPHVSVHRGVWMARVCYVMLGWGCCERHRPGSGFGGLYSL